VLEVEVLGSPAARSAAPAEPEIQRLCELAAGAAGVGDGHLAIEFVEPERIAALNARFRGKAAVTDVLSFPVDGREPLGGRVERELGDVVICPEHTRDLREAIVHGVLHLVGFDHEGDDGEMLRVQRRLLDSSRP
jgi:probable rRNA maturation factor